MNLLALGSKGVYLLQDGQAILIESFQREGHYARTTIQADTCYIAVGDLLYYYTDSMYFAGQFPDNVEVTSLSHGNEGLEVGTRTGAYIPFTDFQNTEQLRMLDGSVVSAIVNDDEGNLWISTVGDGVYFSSSPKTKIYTTESGLALNQVSRLYDDASGAIWLGYRNGSYGVFEQGKVINDPIVTPTNEPVTQIKQNRKGEYLVSSKTYLTYIDSLKKKKYLRMLLNDLLIDSNWVTLASNRTYKIPKADFYSSMTKDREELGTINPVLLENITVPHRTSTLCRDENGNLYMGTDHGLFVENEGISIDLGKNIKGLNAYINDIAFDNQRKLIYVATRGEGVIVIKGTSEVKRYTVKENLSSNTCVGFDLDPSGQLWIGTSEGLDLVPDVSFDTSAIRFGAHIGLRPTTVFDIVRRQDVIYMATNLGLMTYDLRSQPFISNPITPKLTSATVGPTLFGPNDSNIVLKHNENTIRFDFNTVTYKHLQQVDYQYTLEGLQETWHTTQDRGIQFENLEPGTYRFNLRAIHKTGMISKTVFFEFTVLKPFWSLWWFRILSVLTVLGLTWLVTKNRLRAWREKLTLQNRLSEIKIDKLQLEKAYLVAEQKAGIMQMNPHFLFNSLNTIKGYYGQGKMKEANGFIGKFSKLLRKILESNKPLIPLEDEAEILTLYLELMRNRYDQVFDYEINNLVDENLNIQIPPMILQPIVENAVIHGIAPLNEGKISVSFELFDGHLVCKIVDSGVGFTEDLHDQHHSVALENINDRLDILSKQYNKPCTLKILSPVNGGKNPGTAVIVKLPINR